MPPARKSIPSYSIHTQTGQGRAIWYDHTGKRQQKLLPGAFDSTESRTAFAKLQLELVTSPVTTSPVGPVNLTVVELLTVYLDYAEKHYREPDGNPSDEVRHIKTAIRHVRELYGATPVAAFGPLMLKAIQQRFVEQKWSRKTVNARVERVRRIFRWAVAEELVSSSVYQALAAVPGLRRNRTTAPDHEPIGPVEDTVVDATLPYLNRHVRGLVTFQRLTGCRPGEACRIRRCDIDQSDSVWLYRPKQHKTAYKGKRRTIYIGPRAQDVLKGFFTDDVNAYLFDPRKAVEELGAERSANRKTPLYPSSVKRNAKCRVTNPKRRPTARYTKSAYLNAIIRGCDRAFLPVGELARYEKESVAKWLARLTAEQRVRVKQWQKEHHWHPNQLRHAHGTLVRRRFGMESAGASLGHTNMSATEIYAERDTELAATVAREIG